MPEVATRSLPQVPQQEWMSALPSATRFILHGNAVARSAAAQVFGVAFAEQSCRAGYERISGHGWFRLNSQCF